MPRYTRKKYRFHMLALMVIYVVLMLVAWPHAQRAANLPLKIVLALAPTSPIIAILWLKAKQMMATDELQQRLHLMALSIATGVVAVLSMIGGFLADAGALSLDGGILIWVFPALCVSYGIAHVLLGRRYGGMSCE